MTRRFHVISGLLVLGLLAAVAAGCSGPAPQVEPATDETGYDTPAGDSGSDPALDQAPLEPPAPAPKPAATPKPRSTPKPAADTAGAPAPAPPAQQPAAPAPPPVTVAAGTLLDVEFLDTLSSATAVAGDPFLARLAYDVVQNGEVVIPAGSTVFGTVTEAVSLKKIGGRARLGLEFTSLELPSGRSAALNAVFAEEGKSETKKDAATIGGAAGAGALLGRELKDKDRKKGALIGAIVGAAAGAAVAAKTEGQEVEIPGGTVIAIELAAPLVLQR